ncbi:hypothetical protein ANAPC5_01499 [Anaplasma phagocytophilum]|nr:hypothetical protein ANAPC5_01499 [Anaplasma phagocytophilum]
MGTWQSPSFLSPGAHLPFSPSSGNISVTSSPPTACVIGGSDTPGGALPSTTLADKEGQRPARSLLSAGLRPPPAPDTTSGGFPFGGSGEATTSARRAAIGILDPATTWGTGKSTPARAGDHRPTRVPAAPPRGNKRSQQRTVWRRSLGDELGEWGNPTILINMLHVQTSIMRLQQNKFIVPHRFNVDF